MQIEGDQFRLYGGPATATKWSSKKTDELFNLFKTYNWFEEYNQEAKKIRNKESLMRIDYCKYSTTKYTHLYQYWNISKKYSDPCKMEDLCEEIIEELKKVKEKIDNGLGDDLLKLS